MTLPQPLWAMQGNSTQIKEISAAHLRAGGIGECNLHWGLIPVWLICLLEEYL